MNDIQNALINFLETEFPGNGSELTFETPLLTEWFVDSLGIINTVLFLESQFNIQLDRADITADNFQDLNHLLALVDSKQTQ